jgi:PKD repeat protein
MKIKILHVLIILQIVIGAVYGQTITEAEYFVDADPGVGNGTSITITPGDLIEEDFSFSVGDLLPGWHRLSVRVKDDLGRWNVLFGKRFYIYDTEQYDLSKIQPPLAMAEYYFDEDPGQGNGTPIPLIRGDTSIVNRYIPIESLDTGFHYLYIRSMNDRGLWGLHSRQQFYIDTTSCNMPVVDYTYDTVTFGTPTTFTNLSSNTSGGTQFKWDINNDDIIDYTTENISHSFAEAGVYEVKLTVENDTCIASIIKGVVVGPLPDTTILITGLTEFCAGDSVILASNNDPGNHTYSWSTGETTQEITVKSAGTYYVWTTNSYSMSRQSMAVAVEVRDTLDVQLTTANAAGGNANGSAFIDIFGGSGNYSISWSTGATTSIVNNLPAGSYSVTVDDGFCPKTVPFTINNLPVNPGDLFMAEYFIDEDPGVGNGISLNVGAGDSIEFAAQLPLTGILSGYHVLYIRVKNTDGNWSIASRTPFFAVDTDPATPPAAQPQLVEAEYFLDTDPGVGNGIPFTITPGDSVILDPTFPTNDLPLGYHNVFVRVKDEQGKWSLYNGKPFHIYNGEYTDLRKTRRNVALAEYFFDEDPGVGNGNPISFNIYDTVDINRFIPVTELDTGNHIVYMRVMDEDNSWSLWQSESFHIHYVTCTCPVVDFTADTVNVLGNMTTFVNLSSDVDPSATYEWDVDGDDIVDYTTENITHTYADYGIYDARLTIFNSDSCYASIIREVVVSPVIDTSLIVVGDLAFCEGESVILTAQPGYEYNWNNGQTTQSLVVEEAGSYSVRLTNQYGVQGTSQTITVTVYPLPEIQLSLINATGGNANGTAIIDVSGGSGSYTFNWSTGGILSIENNLAEGDYNVVVSDGYCPASQDFHIYDNPLFPGDVIAAEYYYDEDPGIGNATPLNIAGGDSVYFATFIPTTGLSLGYHDLSIRVKNDNYKWSIVHSETVFIIDTLIYPPKIEPPLVSAEYFFDEDPGAGNGIAFPITKADSIETDIQVNTLGLEVGYHTVAFRVMDSLSRWSMVDQQEIFVYESNPTPVVIEDYKIVEAEYFYDNDPGVGNATPIEFSPTADSIEMEQYFPVLDLQPGPHKLYVRAKDEAGKWSIYDYHPFEVIEASCTCPIVDFSSDIVNPGSATTFTDLSDSTYAWTTYEWDIFNDGTIDFTTQNISYNFGGSGIYDVKLTVSNSDTCQASIIQQAIVGPLPNPIVTISGDTEFCAGDSVTLTASAGLNYEWWPNGETSQSIIVKASGTYYAWVTTASGIELKSNVLEITEHDVPEFMLTAIHSTGGNSNGSAFVEASGGSGDYSYLWSNGGSEFYVNDLSSANYSIEIDDGYCPVDSSFFIDDLAVYPGNILAAEYFFNEDPGVGNGIPLNIAGGDTIEMVTGISVAGLPIGYNQLCIRTMDTEFKWSIFHEERIHVYDATEHNIQISQPPLVAAEFFLDIDLNTSLDPGVGLGAPIAVTPGDLLIDDFDYSVDTLSLGYHNVFVRAMDDDGKWSVFKPSVFHIFDTTFYDLTKTQPAIVAAEYFFDEDPGAGNGIALPITADDTIEWTGGINVNALSLGPHKFSIRTMDADMKWSIVGSKDFAIYDCTQPLADFTFTQVCIEDTVHFTDLSTSVDPSAIYEWDIDNDGNVDYTLPPGNLSHKYNVPGTYEVKLKITHNVACSDSIVQTVDFPFVNLGNDTLIYTDQSIVLDAGPGYINYLWSDGSSNQTLTVNGAVGNYTYHVTVANGIGCTDSDTINIAIAIPPRDLIIMNELVNPVLIEAGTETTASCEVHNTGDSLAIASTLNYYISADTILSQSDVYLGFSIVGSLAGGTFESKSEMLTIPPGTLSGIQYILFLADADSVIHESDKDNNLAWYEIEVVASLGIELQLKAFLEGPYDDQTNGVMNNDLIGLSEFPMNQPYNVPPWNYYGFETIASVPNVDIVDWVIVELRETPSTAGAAGSATVIDAKAGFILKDGSIVDIDGFSNLTFNVIINDNLYAVIKHRNHVDIMSASPLILNAGVYGYDFTTGASQVYGGLAGLIHLGAGIYGMAAGDGNADGDVNLSDNNDVWKPQSGQKGYLMSDFSMDSESNNIDKNDVWLPNNGVGSQVPE